VSTEAEI